MLEREVLNPRALSEEHGRAEEQDPRRPASCYGDERGVEVLERADLNLLDDGDSPGCPTGRLHRHLSTRHQEHVGTLPRPRLQYSEALPRALLHCRTAPELLPVALRSGGRFKVSELGVAAYHQRA